MNSILHGLLVNLILHGGERDKKCPRLEPKIRNFRTRSINFGARIGIYYMLFFHQKQFIHHQVHHSPSSEKAVMGECKGVFRGGHGVMAPPIWVTRIV